MARLRRGGVGRLAAGGSNLKQTTGDWHRSTLLEILALPGGSRSKCPLEAAKVTNFVTRLFSVSFRDLTGCHRSVRMLCGSSQRTPREAGGLLGWAVSKTASCD